MNIIFVEPAFPANQRRFVHALASVGADVYGIGESEEAHLGDELRAALRGYVRVGSVTNVQQLIDAVRHVQGQVWVDALEATVEAHTMPAAQAREATNIPGTSVRTTWLCRDKPSMKEALRAAGVPTAASAAVDSSAEAKDFADRVGYPLVVKPRAGAGAQGTVRVDSDDDLARVLHRFGDEGATSLAIEEFVEGHEGFYDTITLDGRVVHDWATHYYPNVLEAMRDRRISPQFITTNRLDDPAAGPFYGEVRELGRRVIEALGIETSATHMEWFYGPKGLRFSEIGCRPPGVGAWDVYSAANDVDVYREWASVITHRRPERQLSRAYAAGLVALRPDRDGVVTGYDGIDEIQQRYGEWILDGHFPPVGQATQPVEAGYLANAYVRLRHPDYDAARAMLDDVGRTITVHAG
ncbi:acetyl-CoA carboxylase biotin carboxylase subunit family protein [Intrasporangium sp.]|uniref:ATP-grasp domain-containing protein n=1 Tax=Intrasporangium sp. TaxID=1925024 RepID=UPI00293A3D7D|nr:ATP-grasp domain-containing protein [Intrasporangium sp.]MDV3222154.1 ATP-grasp domain-containing protein [Intrasporangium sp.]